jgi:hypothetical protein
MAEVEPGAGARGEAQAPAGGETQAPAGAGAHVELRCTTLCVSCRGGEPVGPDGGELYVAEVRVNARGDGWIADGGGAGYCGRCGRLSELITYRVPLELQGLPCTRCRRTVTYEVALDCVWTYEGRFRFTAAVTCPSCAHRSVFRRLVDGLSRIRRISVGPGGVAFDVGDPP